MEEDTTRITPITTSTTVRVAPTGYNQSSGVGGWVDISNTGAGPTCSYIAKVDYYSSRRKSREGGMNFTILMTNLNYGTFCIVCANYDVHKPTSHYTHRADRDYWRRDRLIVI